MSRTSVSSLPEEMGKWLALASALAAFGILPKAWQKPLGAVSAVVTVIKLIR